MGVRIDLAPLTTLCLALLSSEELASASQEGYQRALSLFHFSFHDLVSVK